MRTKRFSVSSSADGVPKDSPSRWLLRLRWAPLVPEALLLSVRYRLRALRAAPLLTGPISGVKSRRSRPPAAVVLRAMHLATAVGPLRTTCLVRSMVLAQMLNRRGYHAEVVVGVPHDGLGSSTRFAHAWVEVDGSPGPAGYRELTRLVP
jgi:hypothetical protein